VFPAIQGASILLLLSAFFAYVIAPIVDAIRRRLRWGRRNRPVSRVAVMVALYLVLFAAGFLIWRAGAEQIRDVVHVSAPAAIDRLFGGEVEPFEAVLREIPDNVPMRAALVRGSHGAIGYLEHEVRSTLDDLLAASRYARWLAVVPLVAFFLITAAPGFRRSAERLLPHGHLQWRAGEYLRDVNSALAGYVRAQLAAGVIVGAICAVGFALLGLRYAVAMGVTAGVLELVPAIGPIAALIMATTQAERGVLGVVAFLVALRLAQDYVIYPRLVRRGMHLATPVVVVSIWCGAVLAGAAGVVLSIPIAGFLSVSLRHWQEYRAIERVVREHAERRPHQEERDMIRGSDLS
jgi:predicted PurR-regulated permease PerM